MLDWRSGYVRLWVVLGTIGAWPGASVGGIRCNWAWSCAIETGTFVIEGHM